MKSPLCCKEMELFINDPRDPIEYNSIFREYFIRLKNRSNIIIFSYCPWCGSKLPVSLRKSYFDVLEKEYNIDTDIGEYKERSDIPDEFKSDKWWKVRNKQEKTFSENNLWQANQWQRFKNKIAMGKRCISYENQRERRI